MFKLRLVQIQDHMTYIVLWIVQQFLFPPFSMQCIRCLRQTSAFALPGAPDAASTLNEREAWWISRWAHGCPMCGGTWVRVVQMMLYPRFSACDRRSSCFCFIKVFIFHFPFFLIGSYYLVEICKIGKLTCLMWFIFGIGSGKKGKFCIAIPFFLKDACGIALYRIV